MKKVVKFGGSSLASAEQFKKVGDIIRADEGRRYVVPSAPGKRNSADTKVTDMLYDCYRTAVAGRDFKKKLQNIKARYQEIIDGLNLSLDLSPEFEKIAENFAAAAQTLARGGGGHLPAGCIKHPQPSNTKCSAVSHHWPGKYDPAGADCLPGRFDLQRQNIRRGGKDARFGGYFLG